MKLLFVCSANVCRSFLAERLAAAMAAERGLTLETRSCGIAAERFFGVPPEIWRIFEELKIPRTDHTPQLVSRPLLQWADATLAMTPREKDFLLESFPEHYRTIFLLRERAGLSGGVADPIGKDRAAFDACLGSIRESLERILAAPPR